MAIVGDHPETGFRVVLERPATESTPWVYEGFVYLPAEKHALSARVDAKGDVTIDAGTAPAAVRDKVRLLVRAVCKGSGDDEGPPPQRITRWRGEK